MKIFFPFFFPLYFPKPILHVLKFDISNRRRCTEHINDYNASEASLRHKTGRKAGRDSCSAKARTQPGPGGRPAGLPPFLPPHIHK